MKTQQERFVDEAIKVESDVYTNLENKLDDFWNLKSSNYSNAEFQKHIAKTHAKNFNDMFSSDIADVEDYYSKFKTNKNNMKQNAIIYETLEESYLEVYNNLKKVFDEDIYKSAFYYYQESLYEKTKNITISRQIGNVLYISTPIYTKSQYTDSNNKYTYKLNSLNETKYLKSNVIENYIQLKEKFLNKNNENLNNILKVIDDNRNSILKIQKEIQDYSITYETKKLNNYYKNKYGNIKNCGDISNVITKGSVLQTGCYYDADSLEVLQITNAGILAKDYGWNSNKIYILTSRKFVDGDNYTGRLMYKGIYQYTSVLGANVTVRKFQEITIPNEEFYFIYK